MENILDMTDTTVMFDERNWIIWSDDVYINMDELKTVRMRLLNP